MFPSREILCGRDWAQVKKWKICLQVQRRSRKKKKEDILQILVIGAVECVFKIQRESKRQTRRAPSGGPDLFPSRWRQFFRGRIRALGWRQQNHEILKRRIRVQFHLWSVQEEAGEGLEADMEREEGGRAEAEPLRGRDKILCYINMQSPGRSSDLDQDQDQHLCQVDFSPTWCFFHFIHVILCESCLWKLSYWVIFSEEAHERCCEPAQRKGLWVKVGCVGASQISANASCGPAHRASWLAGFERPLNDTASVESL